MIADGNGENEKSHRPRKSRSRGRMKRGEGKASRLVTKDLGVIGMAFRHRFPMGKTLRRAVVATIADGLANVDPTIQLAAVRAAVQAERVNVAAERLEQGSIHQHLHLHGGDGRKPPPEAVSPIADAEYIEFAARRIAEGYEQPGGNGAVGDARPMEAVPPPAANESPTNGSSGGKASHNGRNGSNGHHA